LSAILNAIYVPVIFILVLTVVVFIHEMGHFLVARWCGVKVEAFSIGFGREIVGFTDKLGTRWKLSWIPLGGYVKFADDENAASVPSREALERMSPEQRSGAFQAKPLSSRAAIVAAGPAFNIISAVLIYGMTFWLVGSYGMEAVIDEVIPESAAAKAGIQSGDKITEIDGQPIQRFSDLQRIVEQAPGKKLDFTVLRNNRTLSFPITPELREITDPIGNKVQVGAIGVKRTGGADRWQHQKHGIVEAFGLGLRETYYVSEQIITSLPKLPGAILKVFSGQRQSEIGGPIAIAEMTAHASKTGIGEMLRWIAVFSIMLGIMNLLPIPLLDGGHLMFYAIEAVRGRPLDERKQELAFKIGMAILATMMLAAITGDLMRLMRKLGIG
jgi:regulator of sigma E protease